MTGQVFGSFYIFSQETTSVQLKYTLANSALGAIITHALVTEDGGLTVAAESGDVLYWNMEDRKVIFQEKQPDVLQIFFYKNQSRCIAASRWGVNKIW